MDRKVLVTILGVGLLIVGAGAAFAAHASSIRLTPAVIKGSWSGDDGKCQGNGVNVSQEIPRDLQDKIQGGSISIGVAQDCQPEVTSLVYPK